MRRLALSVLTAVALVGCADQSAQESARINQELTNALASVDSATVGFAAGSAQQSTETDLNQNRTDMLTQASAKLDSVVSQGSDVQKLGARQLQADAAAFAATHAMTRAAGNASKLESAALNLMTDIQIIGEIEGRIARMSVPEDKLLTQLQEGVEGVPSSGLDVVNQAISEFEKEQATLRSSLAVHQKTVDGLQTQVDALRAQAQKVRAASFTAEGQKKADLQFEAGKIDRQIEAIESNQNKAMAELAAVDAELKLVDMRIASQQQMAEELNTAITTVEDRTTQRQTSHDEQVALRDQAVSQLLETIKAHVATFETTVSEPFVEASTKLESAIDKVASARGVGRIMPQTSVNMDVLSKRVLLADVNARHATALAGLIQTLEVVSSNLSNADQAPEQIKQIVEPLRTQLDRAIGDTREVVDEGSKLANELDTQISEGDTSKNAVESMLTALEAAMARADAAKPFTVSK